VSPASGAGFEALDLEGVRLYWLDGGGVRLDGGSMFGPVPRPRWTALYPPAEDNTIPLTAHVVLVPDGSAWGVLDGDAPAFPNAGVWVQSLEAREARDETNRAHGVYAGKAFDRLATLGLVREVDGQADASAHVQVHLTGGHSRGHQATLVRGAGGAALVHLGDLLVTSAHLPPAWVSALDDFPLDTIRAKREWLGQAACAGWWVTFSHDVRAVAARLDPNGQAHELWPARAGQPDRVFVGFPVCRSLALPSAPG
jgi:glyoxylase-like metal-dependent hydrolase (beta-lactamase superfamily II)